MNYQDICGSSVADLIKFHPVFSATFSRFAPRDEQNFVDILYQDIDGIISRLQDQAKIIHSESEDQITLRIISCLDMYESYSVTHDGFVNGHCDFVVTHKSKGYRWLGEAKLDNGPAYLIGGFDQLITRYEAGERKHGGLLIYMQGRAPAAQKMLYWMDQLHTRCDPQYEHAYGSCCERRQFSYYSEITHPKSGLPYLIRHMPVMLNWSPKT